VGGVNNSSDVVMMSFPVPVAHLDLPQTPTRIHGLSVHANPRKRLPFLRHSFSMPSPIKQPNDRTSPAEYTCSESSNATTVNRVLRVNNKENEAWSPTPAKRPRGSSNCEGRRSRNNSGRFENLLDVINNKSYDNITGRSFDSNNISYSPTLINEDSCSSSVFVSSPTVTKPISRSMTETLMLSSSPFSDTGDLLHELVFPTGHVTASALTLNDENSSGYVSRPIEDFSYVEELLKTPDSKKQPTAEFSSPSEFFNTPFRGSCERKELSIRVLPLGSTSTPYHNAGVKNQGHVFASDIPCYIPYTPVISAREGPHSAIDTHSPLLSYEPTPIKRNCLANLPSSASRFSVVRSVHVEAGVCCDSLPDTDEFSLHNLLPHDADDVVVVDDAGDCDGNAAVPLSEVFPSILSLDCSLAKGLLISPLKLDPCSSTASSYSAPLHNTRPIPRIRNGDLHNFLSASASNSVRHLPAQCAPGRDIDRTIEAITAALTPIAPAPVATHRSAALGRDENAPSIYTWMIPSQTSHKVQACRMKLDNALNAAPALVVSKKKPSAVTYSDLVLGRTQTQEIFTLEANMFLANHKRKLTSARLMSIHRLGHF
jgi:hypothetical protein